MFGIYYLKASPTQHVFHYSGGRLRREGRSLAFFYFGPRSRLLAVPVASADVPFIVSETTADFQDLTIQGQITYRVSDPKRASTTLDFEIDPEGKLMGDGLEILRQRLVNSAQVLMHGITGQLPLRAALVQRESMAATVLASLRTSAAITLLGVEILNVDILAIKPTQEMSRALEAEAREALQRNADQSVYERRNAAVDQERRIKENELRTEIAVEEKKRQIRETQMAADIAIEEQRKSLIETRATNDRAEADTRAYALDASLKPIKDIDWRTLLAASGMSSDPRFMIALAFREMAENAQKIGELNVSPDLLRSLLAPERK